ncbi:hypothetical protein RIF29_18520 [Crotalaria pallida]|uniref:MRN complex-interacting protein N-terminal domain-containing protein n=1 Tax=Crotalaria pallida TaxID=3830 RepID=A0AAN9FKL0_CROPI
MHQVRQKKKSSNKWSCAVCNQKQSVRKVFAQGFMAKDLRKFVQDFNMSRKSIDDGGEWLVAGTLDPVSEDGEDAANLTEKKTDWSAYLDRDDHQGEQRHGDDDFEPQVVTELDKGMFKKRRLVGNSTVLGGRGSEKLFKKPHFLNSQEEPVKDQGRTLTKTNEVRNNYVTSNNLGSQKCKPATSRVASKWNEYVTEDNGSIELGFEGHSDSGAWNTSILEAITSDQMVEDDVHPDFL